MQIGIFESVFKGPNLAAKLDAVVKSGIRYLQFDLHNAGVEHNAGNITVEKCQAAAKEIKARDLAMSAVSGTYNMCHPDVRVRDAAVESLGKIAAHCKHLGTSVISLCTGTRNTDSMWHYHPENSSPEAWRDLLATMKKAAKAAEEHSVYLGVEPEVSNVIDSAKKARQLIDEVGSRSIKIIMDGANIFHKGELPKMRELLSEACELLGPDIVLAHAKDLDHDGDAGNRAAGEGLLDYAHYCACLRKAKFNGAIVLHGLSEAQVPKCRDFLKEKLLA